LLNLPLLFRDFAQAAFFVLVIAGRHFLLFWDLRYQPFLLDTSMQDDRAWSAYT
jgi:hypothetical protein